LKKFFALFFILFFSFICLSCKPEDDDNETTYTVWTDVDSYSNFESTFNTTLTDGMYLRLEFTSSQWSQISSKMTSSANDEYKHNWTKSQIKDWLLGRGFGDYESTKESAWLTTISHGFIASRTNNTVYYIIK